MGRPAPPSSGGAPAGGAGSTWGFAATSVLAAAIAVFTAPDNALSNAAGKLPDETARPIADVSSSIGAREATTFD